MTKKEKKPQLIELIELVEDMASLVLDQHGMAFIKVSVDGQHKVIGINSQEFADWLRHYYLKATGKPILAMNLKDTCEHFSSMARSTGDKITTSLRNAYVNKCAYVDLSNSKGEVVKLDENGWALSTEPEIYFTKSGPMAELPFALKTSDSNLTELLAPYLNLSDENARYLLIGFTVASFFDLPSKAMLVINGEQGSAKTTTTRIIGQLIDPSKVKTQSTPTSMNDLMVAAANSALLCFDNTSKLPPKLMNMICQLSTGAGFRRRKLYSDLDEIVFEISRMVIINGIDADIISATDLLSRCVQIVLPAISGTQRLSESKLWKNFYNDQPVILGALYDVVVKVISIIDDIELDDATRLTDFCRVGVAVERVLEWPEGAFMNALKTMQAEAMEIALESDVTATGIQRVMENKTRWDGTADRLLSTMNQLCGFELTSQPLWPKSARSLGIKLVKIMPALREQGIVIEKTKSGPRKITITNTNITVNRPVKPESPLNKFDSA